MPVDLSAQMVLCESTNFCMQLIFVNFLNSAKSCKPVLTKHFFMRMLMNGRLQFMKTSIYKTGNIAIYKNKQLEKL